MVKRGFPRQGEVWLFALDPTRGAEIQKTRPCVIVSPDVLNGRLKTVLVVPMTTGGFEAPFRPSLRFQGRDGLLLPDQMRAVDRTRGVKRLGRVDPSSLTALLAILREMFES
jgi:mRNA interferase MazF